MLVAWETMSERNPSMCHDLFTVIREVSDLSDVLDDNNPKCSSSYVKYWLEKIFYFNYKLINITFL